ncbi:hemerythrin superfamily protein [Rhizomicrobium palustre]|uniref:Hemerythrin superfamily protein n=1 Tax=Rhizomicrobium palustre TaxID=189966 RepID=A0A846N1M7_9PROT|nr:hemerythrin domain-containing protein [Rhizomicrobium palustre]NIK89848.1 hemerythrin superfamily protein [Rhizomicrobium palustre]
MHIVDAAKNKAKKVMADVEENIAETDILHTLKTEHREVAALLKEMVEAENGASRKKLLGQIKAALIPHLRAEEKVVYQPLIVDRDKGLRTDGFEGEAEHRLADRLMDELSAIENAASPEFAGTAKVLMEMIEHHVKEEEDDIFDDVKEKFSKAERFEMNEAFLAEKTKVSIS